MEPDWNFNDDDPQEGPRQNSLLMGLVSACLTTRELDEWIAYFRGHEAFLRLRLARADYDYAPNETTAVALMEVESRVRDIGLEWLERLKEKRRIEREVRKRKAEDWERTALEEIGTKEVSYGEKVEGQSDVAGGGCG